MSKIRIELDKAFDIKEHLDWMNQMVPWWCDFIVIKNGDFDPSDGNPCACNVDIEYRHGSITLYPNFLLDSKRRQIEYLKHELFHFEIAWIVDWSDVVIKRFLDGSCGSKIIIDEFRRRVENVVQSLARKYHVNQEHGRRKSRRSK